MYFSYLYLLSAFLYLCQQNLFGHTIEDVRIRLALTIPNMGVGGYDFTFGDYTKNDKPHISVGFFRNIIGNFSLLTRDAEDLCLLASVPA